MEQRQPFQQTLLEQWNIPIKKNESRYRPQTFHKNNLKWITDLNIKLKTRNII